jgi:hypothetical protein
MANTAAVSTTGFERRRCPKVRWLLLACYIQACDKPGQALPVSCLARLSRLVLSASDALDGVKGGCRHFLWVGVECTRVQDSGQTGEHDWIQRQLSLGYLPSNLLTAVYLPMTRFAACRLACSCKGLSAFWCVNMA